MTKYIVLETFTKYIICFSVSLKLFTCFTFYFVWHNPQNISTEIFNLQDSEIHNYSTAILLLMSYQGYLLVLSMQNIDLKSVTY